MSKENLLEGVLLVDKIPGSTSFQIVRLLRKKLEIKKIGHAGTLDPFASGVMVMLIGRKYTKLSSSFLLSDKEYIAKLCLGMTTDTYDCEGQITHQSSDIPCLEKVEEVIECFQGEISQIPPMYSAKKIKGKKLYELARKGIECDREPVRVHVSIQCIAYQYPYLELKVVASKGTYIRSLAYDIGLKLGCGAHLVALQRTRSGQFLLNQCLNQSELSDMELPQIRSRLIKG